MCEGEYDYLSLSVDSSEHVNVSVNMTASQYELTCGVCELKCKPY